MKYYRVEPTWKKSIFEYQGYGNDDNSIQFDAEEMYRWGHVIIQLEEDQTLEDVLGHYDNDNNIAEFDSSDIIDIYLDDQCSFYFNNVVGIDEEELDEKFEENGYDYLQEQWNPTHSYVEIHGKLKVTDVTEKYNNE